MQSVLQPKPIVKKLVAMSIACALLTAPTVEKNYGSAYAAEDSVVLSLEEADSLIHLIDEQTLDIELLRIDIREARLLARADSLLHEEQLRVYREAQPNWFERFFKKPEVWFMIGVISGLYAKS